VTDRSDRNSLAGENLSLRGACDDFPFDTGRCEEEIENRIIGVATRRAESHSGEPSGPFLLETRRDIVADCAKTQDHLFRFGIVGYSDCDVNVPREARLGPGSDGDPTDDRPAYAERTEIGGCPSE